MTDLVIEKTDNTPHIILDSSKRLIEISGESRPENTKVFFTPIFHWIEEYGNHLHYYGAESKKDYIVKLNFKLEYFNSSSAKFFIDIIKMLHKIECESPKVKMSINWFYESDDDDLFDAGKEFVKMTKIPMNFMVM